MTRIASYGLYQCPACRQIHIKPNYGSISTYVPLDAFIDYSDVVQCKGCGIKQIIADFLYLGVRSKQNSYKPSLIRRLSVWLGFAEPKPELDVRKQYPALLD